jgi:zona occludens toxin
MAITFHEGEPRSGKSYEAMQYIERELKKGRDVVTNIDGIDDPDAIAKWAKLLNWPVRKVAEKLRHVPMAETTTIWQHAPKDGVVVIDEVQDFWPAGRQRVDEDMTRFITQHGHDGIDILLLGQDALDCHNLFKRRIAQKIVFQKLDFLGKADKYRWTSYRAIRSNDKVKYAKVTAGEREYEEKYFGLYRSHTDGTTNTDALEDDRLNVWKAGWLKKLGVAIVLLLGVGIWGLSGVFGKPDNVISDQGKENVKPARTVTTTRTTPRGEVPATPMPPAPIAVVEKQKPAEDYFDQVVSENDRISASGIVRWSDRPGMNCEIVRLERNNFETNRFWCSELQEWGYAITPYGRGLKLTKGDRTYYAHPLPVDRIGKATAVDIDASRGRPPARVAGGWQALAPRAPTAHPGPARTPGWGGDTLR